MTAYMDMLSRRMDELENRLADLEKHGTAPRMETLEERVATLEARPQYNGPMPVNYPELPRYTGGD